jgi:hypothetical protein
MKQARWFWTALGQHGSFWLAESAARRLYSRDLRVGELYEAATARDSGAGRATNLVKGQYLYCVVCI